MLVQWVEEIVPHLGDADKVRFFRDHLTREEVELLDRTVANMLYTAAIPFLDEHKATMSLKQFAKDYPNWFSTPEHAELLNGYEPEHETSIVHGIQKEVRVKRNKALVEKAAKLKNDPDAFAELLAQHQRENPDPRLRTQPQTSWDAESLLDVEFPPPRFAVADLLVAGLTFDGGAAKIGKSWWFLDLGLAISSGGKAFGSIPVDQGEVLYLALEDSGLRLQSRLRMILHGEPTPKGFHIETEWPRLGAGGEQRIDDWLDVHPDARLVMIDTWPRIKPAREGRNHDLFDHDYMSASIVQALAIRRDIAIPVAMHIRKGAADDFVEKLNATNGLAAAADAIIVIERSRGQSDATLKLTARDIEERELAMSIKAGAWTILGNADEFAGSEVRVQLTKAIRMHGSLTPKTASELVNINYATCKSAMWRMANEGRLVANRGRYSLPIHDPKEVRAWLTAFFTEDVRSRPRVEILEAGLARGYGPEELTIAKEELGLVGTDTWSLQ